MQRFLVRRFLLIIATLLAVSLIIFIMARQAGDPRVFMLSEEHTEEQWERVGQRLGLDKPLYTQFGIYLKNLGTGDLGDSIRERRPVKEVLWDRFPASLELGLAAFVLSIVVGLPLGVLSAVRRGTVLDQIGKVIALLGQSAPPFWLGIMFIFFFAVHLRWLPVSGRTEWSAVVLPAVTLGWFLVAANLRLVRSAMLDVLDSEYIKLARAKGVPGQWVVWNHALRNAVIPALTFAGVTLGSLVAGSMTVEVVFAWPGLGQLGVQALRGSDYPLLQGVVIVYTLLYVLAAFLVDVLYAYIDPRIRYA